MYSATNKKGDSNEILPPYQLFNHFSKLSTMVGNKRPQFIFQIF